MNIDEYQRKKTDDIKTIKARIQQEFEKRGITVKDFWMKFHGCADDKGASKFNTGTTAIPADELFNIACFFDCSVEWLLTGKGRGPGSSNGDDDLGFVFFSARDIAQAMETMWRVFGAEISVDDENDGWSRPGGFLRASISFPYYYHYGKEFHYMGSDERQELVKWMRDISALTANFEKIKTYSTVTNTQHVILNSIKELSNDSLNWAKEEIRDGERLEEEQKRREEEQKIWGEMRKNDGDDIIF